MASRSDRCQLYLIVSNGRSGATPAELAVALQSAPVACVLFGPAAPGATHDEACVRAMLAVAQHHGVAALVLDDAALAGRVGADGVHLSLTGAVAEDPLGGYARARSAAGSDKIVGVEAGQARHLAMEIGEAGADYVAFAEAEAGAEARAARAELVTWWCETFVVPGVAWGVDDVGEARALAAAGVDFVALTEAAWRRGGAVRDAVCEFAEAIDATSVPQRQP